MKYYKFVCERGHCGRSRSSEIVFAIAAPNMVEALKKARMMPSVKHSRLPLSGREITSEEYNEYREVSAYKRYRQGR